MLNKLILGKECISLELLMFGEEELDSKVNFKEFVNSFKLNLERLIKQTNQKTSQQMIHVQYASKNTRIQKTKRLPNSNVKVSILSIQSAFKNG